MRVSRPSVPYLLSTMNAGYHADGTIRTNGRIVARYYKCDRLTDSNLADIRKHYPNAERRVSSPMYAPEIQKPTLVIPTKLA
jgi:hypothetical protein